MSDSNIAQEFYTEFQAIRNDITTRLSTATGSQISELSTQLALLRKQFVDVRQFLPPYDQRQHEMQLKSWEQALEKLQKNQSSSGTKPKFSFKRKDRPERPLSDTPEAEAPIPSETISRSSPSHFFLTSKSGCLLTPLSLSDASSVSIDSELIITNLKDCIVDLIDSNGPAAAPTAVHVYNATNCVLLLPAIRGSILLDGLRRCTVVTPDCHQFRMHTSEQVDVYLPTVAKLVIEKCIGIQFSEYPADPRLCSDEPKNEFRVEDFSHIRQTPSPNWTPRNDKTATLNHWLEKFRGDSRGTSELDLRMLDEILPCGGVRGGESSTDRGQNGSSERSMS